jgi:hypothetical protein
MKQLSEMTVQALLDHKGSVMQKLETAQKSVDMDALATSRDLLKRIDAEIARRVPVGAV